MPRKEGQKAKMLVLLHIFEQRSDINHRLSVPMLEQLLREQDIACERKSIYTDIDALRRAGYDIELVRGVGGGYYLENRQFQLAELEILADAVENSRFISKSKSMALIKKLSTFTSQYSASKLMRQVFISGRVKSMNESVYYNVDALHRAIAQNQQISFRYGKTQLQSGIKKRTEKQHEVSPFTLVYEENNYYLIAYQNYTTPAGLRHYRVDRMTGVNTLEKPRLGQDEYKSFDLGSYTKKMFSMYPGKDTKVTLRCSTYLLEAMTDRFGQDFIAISEDDGTHFHFDALVSVSPPFFGWVAGFGGEVEIAAPSTTRAALCDFLQKAADTHAVTHG